MFSKLVFSFLIEDIFQTLPHIIIVLVPDLKIKIKIKIIINIDARDNIIAEFPLQNKMKTHFGHRNCVITKDVRLLPICRSTRIELRRREV
jgi:hypothetical protein